MYIKVHIAKRWEFNIIMNVEMKSDICDSQIDIREMVDTRRSAPQPD